MNRDTDTRQEDYSRSGEQSPGKLLAWGRECAGLTQEQVAKELYMTLGKVKSIEGDDYNRLHSDTFVRGYLRAYANLVKVDVEQVLSAYDVQAQRLGLVKEHYVKPKADNANIPMWRFIVLIIVVLTVLWLISRWFLGNRQEPDYQMTAPVTTELLNAVASSSVQSSSAVQVLDTNAANAVSLAGEVTTEEVTLADTSTGSASSATSSDAKSPTLIASPMNASGLDQIELIFNDECWLEVSDSNGDVLATDLEPAGSRLVIKGKAPFDVKLGNAPAVEMYLNGKNVPIVPAIGTDVLTLKVSE